MSQFFTLTCPTCGAKLKLADRISLLVCANCGNEHMVNRGDGAIYLVPMAEDIGHIRTGIDKTAAELAVARLQKEIEDTELRFIRAEESDYVAGIPASNREVLASCAAISSFVIALACLANGQNVAAIVCFVVLVASVVVQAAARDKRIREANRRKDIDLDTLQYTFNQTSAALQKNRQIANS